MRKPKPGSSNEEKNRRFSELSKYFVQFARSVWFFPFLLTLIFILLVSLRLNGSSMGWYHDLFYGDKDSALILNEPRGIRSDEWLVGTQTTMAQAQNDFHPINKHIGNGEDMTVLGDLPTKDWSVLFKPQSLGYLLMPFDNAFAFHWWLSAYLLLLSVYFFAYLYLPSKFSKKIWLSILLSLITFFSPFIQWWYLTNTLGVIYSALFGLILFKLLLQAKTLLRTISVALVFSYLLTCFVLMLYPPFQIPCALVAFFVAIAILLESRSDKTLVLNRFKVLVILGSLVASLLVVSLFLYQHKGAVTSINSTAYPGHRVVASGGFSPKHFFANHLNGLMQNDARAAEYPKFIGYPTNQSESANFILLLPFTVPALAILSLISIKKYKVKPYSSLALIGVSILFTIWLFVPHFAVLGKITLLDKVPQGRMLIGVGLLNLLALIDFIRLYSSRSWIMSKYRSLGISGIILLGYLGFNWVAANQAPGFIAHRWAILFALPIPLVIFLLLRKRFVLSLLVLLSFSIISTYRINPLYQGTGGIRKSQLSTAIQRLTRNDTRRWITDTTVFENLAAANGANSLAGTYLYPQNDIWKKNFPRQDATIYNRYAHVIFMLDRDAGNVVPDKLQPVGDDQFWVKTEPCSPVLSKLRVGFIITPNAFSNENASCLQLADQIKYPRLTVYIYEFK